MTDQLYIYRLYAPYSALKSREIQIFRAMLGLHNFGEISHLFPVGMILKKNKDMNVTQT